VRFTYHSLSAIEAQPQNCPFAVNTTIQLKNVTATSHNNDIQRGPLCLRSVPVLSEVAIYFSRIVILTPDDNF